MATKAVWGLASSEVVPGAVESGGDGLGRRLAVGRCEAGMDFKRGAYTVGE